MQSVLRNDQPTRGGNMAATYTFDVFSSLDGFGSASGGDWGGYWGKQGPELLDHRLALYGETGRRSVDRRQSTTRQPVVQRRCRAPFLRRSAEREREATEGQGDDQGSLVSRRGRGQVRSCDRRHVCRRDLLRRPIRDPDSN